MGEIDQTLDELGDKVQREIIDRSTKQKPDENTFFTSTYNWVKKAEMIEPEWGNKRSTWVDNRERDRWLMMMARAEPHLSSVLSTAVTLDGNRQFKIVGGRNQVLRFTNMFSEFDDGRGFRTMQELNATNYYSSDAGAIVEIETDGKNGPLMSLYHTDSTRFRLGKKRTLKYDTVDIWNRDSYYRLASQMSTEDKYNTLGYSAISRCLKLAQIMIAVVEHNLEKLGHLAPKGILFIQAEDLTQESWDEAMQAREAVYVTNTGNQYYDEVMTVVDRAAKGELLALSQLPDNFDTFQFTDYMIKGYALAFGRDVRAFWSLNSGNFGGGTEAKIQSEKATYAGGAEFILASQEQIQKLLPPSILFEYEVDDTKGKTQKAELDALLIESAVQMQLVGISPQLAQVWLAEHGVIPAEWTEIDGVEIAENGTLTEGNAVPDSAKGVHMPEATLAKSENKRMKDKWLDTEHVQRAMELDPDEPIVMYESPSVRYPSGRTVRLWDNAKHASGISWRGFDSKKNRTQASELELEGDNRGNEMFVGATESYLNSVDEDDLTAEQVEALALALALLSSGEEITDEQTESLDLLLIGAVGIAIVLLLRKLRDKSNDALDGAFLLRPDLWERRLRYFTNLGFIALGDPDELLTWSFGNTIEHCSDCQTFNGQTKTRAEWQAIGLVPQSPDLSCEGFNCDCSLS